MINLTPDELLTTTRSVRMRLDFDRPVGREVIEECIVVASQAPNAGNAQKLHFVVITDRGKRVELAELFRKGSAAYIERARATVSALSPSGDPGKAEAMKRLYRSASYLNEHIQDVPVHVIPCISGRTDGAPVPAQAARWGSIFPAAWSFMLAGRARGLGTTFTSFHLLCEEEAADLLGIPFKEVMQAGLLPVAYTKGSKFRPASRPPLAELVHWDGW